MNLHFDKCLCKLDFCLGFWVSRAPKSLVLKTRIWYILLPFLLLPTICSLLLRSHIPISGPIYTSWTTQLLFPKTSERHKSLFKSPSYIRYYFKPVVEMNHLIITTNLWSTWMCKTKGLTGVQNWDTKDVNTLSFYRPSPLLSYNLLIHNRFAPFPGTELYVFWNHYI